jgi:FkbM family methyltransferase
MTKDHSDKGSLWKTLQHFVGLGADPFNVRAQEMIRPFENDLQVFWPHLDENDKQLFLALIAYRVLGFEKVWLPRNTPDYWRAVEVAKTLCDPSDVYDPKFMHFLLKKFDLSPIGYQAKLYLGEMGVAIDFIVEQYALKRAGQTVMSAEDGDVVIDAGACWGDTALYFADKVGRKGRVYSFEFIPGNVKLFEMNMALNEHVRGRVKLVKNPVFNRSKVPVYFSDFGPGSRVSASSFEGQSGSVETLSIDDFVRDEGLDRVDLIKMDIEGSEMNALMGAVETIRRFRPKLAISSYHSLDDMFKVPRWIVDQNLGYKLHLDHYTIHAEETVCFGVPIS